MLAIAVLTAGLLRAVMEKWAPARRAGAHQSITARSSPAVSTAIASIRADAWTPIHYPNAVWDEAEQRLISDAEIAEVPFTAFTSRRTADHISGRLMVRRVKRLNPTAKTATSVAGGDRQGELFALNSPCRSPPATDVAVLAVGFRRFTRRTISRPLMWSAVRREVNAVNGTSAISASLIRRCSASSQTALG